LARKLRRMRTLTAVVRRDGDWYVARCPEVGTVSQGKTVEEAVTNLQEATELFLEDFGHELGVDSDSCTVTHFAVAV